MTTPRTIAIVGGTGPQGRGLGLRFALAGHAVVLGSRDAERATQAAAELEAKAAERGLALAGRLTGAGNADACAAADTIVVAVPYDAQRATLEPLAEAAAGKVVVNCVNNLAFDAQGPHPVPVPDGSAAQECARLLPAARVASAFGNVSATLLLRAPDPVAVDVLVCADDDDARAVAVELAGTISGARGVEAGALRLAGPVEDLTAVLLAVNKRYKTHAGVRIDGV